MGGFVQLLMYIATVQRSPISAISHLLVTSVISLITLKALTGALRQSWNHPGHFIMWLAWFPDFPLAFVLCGSTEGKPGHEAILWLGLHLHLTLHRSLPTTLMYTHTHTLRACVCMRVSDTYIHTYTHSHTHSHIHTCIRAHAYVHIHSCTHTCTYTSLSTTPLFLCLHLSHAYYFPFLKCYLLLWCISQFFTQTVISQEHRHKVWIFGWTNCS